MPEASELFPCYVELAERIDRWAMVSKSPGELRRTLKGSEHWMSVKKAAVDEVTSLYSRVAERFALPSIPIRMPLRIKARVLGVAVSRSRIPEEIRIYLLIAPSPHAPLSIESASFARPTHEILDTFIHECAHVLDIVRTGRSDHGPNFESCRAEIAEYLGVPAAQPPSTAPATPFKRAPSATAARPTGCAVHILLMAAGGFWLLSHFIFI